MSLLKLPTELLLKILDHVGSDGFRRDLRLLTISKDWYEHARLSLHRNLNLSATSLQRLLNSPTLNETRALIQTQTTAIAFSLSGSADLSTAGNCTVDVDQQPPVPDFAEMVMQECTDRLITSISRLRAILQPCAQLHRLKVEARRQYYRHFDTILGPRPYLPAPALITLFSVGNLTSLEIDTAGTHFIGFGLGPPSDDMHLCSAINALLPTLRRVRCRMCSICDVLLKLPAAGDEDIKRFCLEEVVIDLSLAEPAQEVNASLRYPTECWPASGITSSSIQLKSRVEEQARNLALRLEKPKMVRVLSHLFPSLLPCAYDALTDRILLNDGARWDVDGDVLEERVMSDGQEIDLFDTDSSESE